MLSEYYVLQVRRVGELAPSHSHVDNSGALTRGNLAFRLALLLLKRWRYQLVVVGDEINEEDWKRLMEKLTGIASRLTSGVTILNRHFAFNPGPNDT